MLPHTVEQLVLPLHSRFTSAWVVVSTVVGRRFPMPGSQERQPPRMPQTSIYALHCFLICDIDQPMKRISVLVFALLATASAASATTVLIDGDTFVLDGERIRIIEIDTPETFRPRCENELILGLKAKERLRALLDSGPLTVVREGHDYWRRTLAHVYAGETDIGQTMLTEGYALPYVKGPKAKASRLAQWCKS